MSARLPLINFHKCHQRNGRIRDVTAEDGRRNLNDSCTMEEMGVKGPVRRQARAFGERVDLMAGMTERVDVRDLGKEIHRAWRLWGVRGNSEELGRGGCLRESRGVLICLMK